MKLAALFSHWKDIGVVSLGQTIITARVVASKVLDAVKLLISEADGILAQDYPPAIMQSLHDRGLKIELQLQEWIDKDGRVTFIKIKLVDPSCRVFSKGESGVTYLLEYVGDESECRRFYPNLVEQFEECNTTLFQLNNGLALTVLVIYASGDHKASWAKTGRSGGHDQRDLNSDHSSAAMYHLIAFQDTPQFDYKRHIHTFKTVQREMQKWKKAQLDAKIIVTDTARRIALYKLYNIHGRVERLPALMYGDKVERPSVYNKLLITPLVLHNQSYCNLITLELGLKKIVKDKSPKLKKLKGRLQGLVDGIGTTKCATSGNGLRQLLNDCMYLESDTKPTFQKYSPIWYLMDNICRHLHLKGKNKTGEHLALVDFERLCFASCTFVWWALMGDLSHKVKGRILKTCTKNHLEDKIYPYELVNACPEWEEHIKVPLSLLDESLFEASFAPRDEMINSHHSKVAIQAERKEMEFKRMANVLAPVRKHRSIMAGLAHHDRRNIIIRPCWRNNTKWSVNLRSGFLPRCARYSYHNLISLSTTQAIHINITGPVDAFYDLETTLGDVIIDPCGNCSNLPPPTSFDKSLLVWRVFQHFKYNLVRRQLHQSYTVRLKRGHLKRASIHYALVTRHSRPCRDPAEPSDVKEALDKYNIYRAKYPLDLSPVNMTTRLTTLIAKATKALKQHEFWDGDISTLPVNLTDITSDKTWTIKKLKSVLRFFKLHDGQDKTLMKLKGRRDELLPRVITLLQQYRTIAHLPSI